jgi:hypothetical protein
LTDGQRKDGGDKPKDPWHGDPKLLLPKILLALGFVSILGTFIIAGTSYFSTTSEPAPPVPTAPNVNPPVERLRPAPSPPFEAAPPPSSPFELVPTAPILLGTLFAGITTAIAGGVLYLKRRRRLHKKTDP